MMTEEEAEGKWCPFAMAPASYHNEVHHMNNREYSGHGRGNCRCLASACMVWQWEENYMKLINRGVMPMTAPNRMAIVVDIEAKDQWLKDGYKLRTSEYRGYCGLAGRP